MIFVFKRNPSCHILYQYWHFTADWISGAEEQQIQQYWEPGILSLLWYKEEGICNDTPGWCRHTPPLVIISYLSHDNGETCILSWASDHILITFNNKLSKSQVQQGEVGDVIILYCAVAVDIYYLLFFSTRCIDISTGWVKKGTQKTWP